MAAESALMVPDTRARLEAAAADLSKALVREDKRDLTLFIIDGEGVIKRPPSPPLSSPSQDDLAADAAGTPELAAAQQALNSAQGALAA